MPTLIPFLRSNHARPHAIVVFPISVSVPVINTPCNFSSCLVDKSLFVNKTQIYYYLDFLSHLIAVKYDVFVKDFPGVHVFMFLMFLLFLLLTLYVKSKIKIQLDATVS